MSGTTPVLEDPRAWGADDYQAVFFGWERSIPTYHGFDWDRHAEPGISRDYTRCGLLIAEYDHETGRLRELAAWLPLRHAVKFGKPCRKCFRRPVSSLQGKEPR